MEVIEHKGYGHPDSITDAVVESCAEFLDKYYLTNYKQVLHYNVDKALFLAGDYKVSFSCTEIIEHPKFILGGQVSELDSTLKYYLKERIKTTIYGILPRLIGLEVMVMSGNVSATLNNIAENNLANDTSFGVGYYPLSIDEEVVLSMAKLIKEETLKPEPLFGPDFKIMLTSDGINISIPVYYDMVNNMEEYNELLDNLEDKLWVSNDLNVNINNERHTTNNMFLTSSGSSIECGDDGQVGRGNRLNGLITPGRPMTMEAYHGKNNKNHTGKLYQKMAQDRAKEIYEKTGKTTYVTLVSEIGADINNPKEYIKHE